MRDHWPGDRLLALKASYHASRGRRLSQAERGPEHREQKRRVDMKPPLLTATKLLRTGRETVRDVGRR